MRPRLIQRMVNISFLQDQDSLGPLIKQHFDLNLESKELSWRGWNWGATDFRGKSIGEWNADLTNCNRAGLGVSRRE